MLPGLHILHNLQAQLALIEQEQEHFLLPQFEQALFGQGGSNAGLMR
jgi:hypothetical protein